MNHTDIDLEALKNECEKLSSIAFSAAVLERHGQVEFTATVQLIREYYAKIGELLCPPEPELLTPHTP